MPQRARLHRLAWLSWYVVGPDEVHVGRWGLGLFAGYEITPLLKWNNYLVRNLEDRSRYFSPSLAYSIRSDFDWGVGIQFFGGSDGSEYGRFHNAYYTQVQWFF